MSNDTATVTTDPAPADANGPRRKRGVPEGLWLRCDSCSATIFRKQVEKMLHMCPECGHHFYVPAMNRIAQLLDEDSFEEWYGDMISVDPLGFADKKPYKQRLIDEQKKTGMKDACVVGKGYLKGRPLVFGLTDSAFIMGSMGSVVGEKLTRAIEEATRLRLPLVIVSGSGGGARMHEGIYSLMQMGKVSAALARYDAAGGLSPAYVALLLREADRAGHAAVSVEYAGPEHRLSGWSAAMPAMACGKSSSAAISGRSEPAAK